MLERRLDMVGNLRARSGELSGAKKISAIAAMRAAVQCISRVPPRGSGTGTSIGILRFA